VAKLLDFGLVQDLSAEAAPLTGAGLVIGTPAYMCPEQAGGMPADRRGDLYSLGALAFFTLTGRPPFECDSVGRYLTAHLTQTPPRGDEVRPGMPGDLSAVVARCLEKNPADRFQTAAELDEALGRCGCAGGWSAARAAAWWAVAATGSPGPTRTFDAAEVAR
jgi:serine/threonine-protein kinase